MPEGWKPPTPDDALRIAHACVDQIVGMLRGERRPNGDVVLEADIYAMQRTLARACERAAGITP